MSLSSRNLFFTKTAPYKFIRLLGQIQLLIYIGDRAIRFGNQVKKRSCMIQMETCARSIRCHKYSLVECPCSSDISKPAMQITQDSIGRLVIGGFDTFLAIARNTQPP